MGKYPLSYSLVDWSVSVLTMVDCRTKRNMDLASDKRYKKDDIGSGGSLGTSNVFQTLCFLRKQRPSVVSIHIGASVIKLKTSATWGKIRRVPETTLIKAKFGA